jgi:hypothetical protein
MDGAVTLSLAVVACLAAARFGSPHARGGPDVGFALRALSVSGKSLNVAPGSASIRKTTGATQAAFAKLTQPEVRTSDPTYPAGAGDPCDPR